MTQGTHSAKSKNENLVNGVEDRGKGSWKWERGGLGWWLEWG